MPAVFWATAVFLPVFFVIAGAYPYLERKMTGDNALHNLLQRPRDAPVRTSLGAMAIAAYVVLLVSSLGILIALNLIQRHHAHRSQRIDRALFRLRSRDRSG